MVWKNFSYKNKNGNYEKKRAESIKVLKEHNKSFYSKDYQYTKDNVFLIRPKPSFLEKVQ